MKTCPRCGYSNRDEYRFCAKCGFPLESVALSTTSPPSKPTSSKFHVKAIIGLVATVLILIVITAIIALYIQPDGEILTPEEVSSILGGTWNIGNDTFYFSVNENNVTFNYFNGSKGIVTSDSGMSSSVVLGPELFNGISSGQVEVMYGNINGTNITLFAEQFNYLNSSDANQTYYEMSFLLALRGHQVTLNGDSFIENITYQSTSLMVQVKGDELNVLSIRGTLLNPSELSSLMGDF